MDEIKPKKADNAVSEVVGTILLLMLAAGLFSVIYISILSVSLFSPTSSINIIGTLDGNDIILEHRGGKALDLDTIFIVTNGSSYENLEVGDYLNNESKSDEAWNIGERLVYPSTNITGLKVTITVVDKESNSVIMMGTFQG